MKPITDDVVYSIMQGLERRERRQKVSLERTKATLSEKILGFEALEDFAHAARLGVLDLGAEADRRPLAPPGLKRSSPISTQPAMA